MEIVFVLSKLQNHFFLEMAETLVAELIDGGTSARISTDGFPEMMPGRVYVLFPPHEYFVLEGNARGVDSRLLKRTIFISAEQPGTVHFDDNVRLAESAGRVFDINAASIREYRWRDVDASLLQLGYSPYLDHFDATATRDIDVLFMGCITPRRGKFLAGVARQLDRYQAKLILSDNSRPNTATSATYLAGEEKLSALKRSSLLLNIHQSDAPYFEWARVLDAIHCGSVLVTEHSTDFGPLVPGSHFASSRPESLWATLEGLLSDPGRVEKMRQEAYDFIRSELPLSASTQLLVEAAQDLDKANPILTRSHSSGPAPTVTEIDFSPSPLDEDDSSSAVHPGTPFTGTDPEVAMLRRALKEVRLDIMDLRRLGTRAAMTVDGTPPPPVRFELATPAYRMGAKPRISVITALYNHGSEIVEALDSLVASEYTDLEIVVVNDGSSDNSRESVTTWAERHPAVPLLLLTHPVNRGLGHARNTALDFARGEFVFVLDSDNAVYPHGIGGLVDALDGDQSASFAYGILASFRNEKPYGLVSYFPWEPERLPVGNYIDAMALFRQSALRAISGYTTDRRLWGWEDYDLYCRFAEAQQSGVFVDHVVALYRSSDTSMLSLTNISTTSAFVALKEHAPKLMEQVVPPQ